jgi:hypothetical protein
MRQRRCRQPDAHRLCDVAARSAKGHLLNAGICLLASVNADAMRAGLERYCDLDINFDNSREHGFLSVRCAALRCAGTMPW